MDSSQILYNKIFNLPQSHQDIKSLKKLADELQDIITQIKALKLQGRQLEIEKKCYRNQKLTFVSKLLKEYYFRVYPPPPQPEDSSTLKNLPQQQLQKKQSLPPVHLVNLSSHSYLGNSRYMPSNIELKLKNLLISMFQHMLVNEKMLTFINYMSIPLYIYIILLGTLHNYGKYCLQYKKTEKCLKFIYQYIKITKQSIPKVYIHLLKHFLQLYHKNYEIQFKESDKKDRVRLCFSYIYQISALILKKNLFLASKCGILSLLYHKCIQGAFTIHKVETTLEIIINFCIEQKSRDIIYTTIDFGKTFAIFTNVDLVESIHEKLSIVNKSKVDVVAKKNEIKNLDGIQSCAVMIEMYLSNWSTLIYFLQEGRTLKNFIISLKRKSEQQISILNNKIFKKIMKRCLNYNRKKVIKSNNIFSIQSNYLILKSLLILNFFYKHEQFKELVYGNSLLQQFKQNFIEVLLQYFISNEQQYKNRELNKLLINNIKNINYYKKINIDLTNRKQEGQGMINNNIESYYSETLLPFEFSIQEIKEYLIKIIDIIDNEQSKENVCALLTQLSEREMIQLYNKTSNNGRLEEIELLKFYKLGLQISQQIKWLDRYLDISKYLSSILQHLRQSSWSIVEISERCRQYIRCIFEHPQQRYFQVLNINILDDIGRYFYSDNKIIEYLNGYISDMNQAYKISRILLHIDYERNSNQSIEGPQIIYGEISKRGSKALILQIIQIIKYSCEQNDNRFINQHVQILFKLIQDNDEDIVYSIIQLLQEFINKSKELKDKILEIDMKKIKHWHKRVLYLFLHYQNAIPEKKQANNSTFLNDQLQKWESGENRKKTYYSFVMRELKKFTQESILSTDYLNLNLDPSNHRKLIFLPWNIKINEEFYPIFIEYKNLQDKLKLKIYLNLIIMKQLVIEEMFIGSHNYTKYIEVKHIFEKKKEDRKIKITLEEIKKEHAIKGKQFNKLVINRQQTIFFVSYEQEIYKIDRININLPLTLDTYRPLSHPLNFINLLCRTKMGFEFLKKQKFIEHCLDIIRGDQQQSKQQQKGALVCLGTLCASCFMSINEKFEFYELIVKKISSKDHEIQEICLWIMNILIKQHIIRSKIKKEFILIETKRCGWVCLPDLSCSFIQKHNSNFKQRMERNIRYIKDNLPQKIENDVYRHLCNILNQACTEEQSRASFIVEPGKLDGRVAENIIKYISVIDFPPGKIYQMLHKLGSYFISDKFELDFPNGLLLP